MIEFDGEQHFSPVELWGGEDAYKKQRETETEKNEWCEKNGIPLLRIRYDQKPLICELVKDFLENPKKYLQCITCCFQIKNISLFLNNRTSYNNTQHKTK